MKKIALYGGAFSPPHLGHASVLEGLLRLFPCDEIWVMPSADRHDKKVSASAENRLAMLEIMANELFPKPKIPIIISDFEITMNRPTVTYETLKMLGKKFPDNIFYFVLGAENIGLIKTRWVNGEKLFNEACFVAIKHPDQELPAELPPHFTLLENVPRTEISSTFIRKLIGTGHSGIPYLSRGVAEYIRTHDLYK